MRKAILMLALASVSIAANSSTLWKCTGVSGPVIYTNQGAERVSVLACSPTTINNSETKTPEKKYSCSVKFENGSKSSIRNTIVDRDEAGTTRTCVALSGPKPKAPHLETGSNETVKPGSARPQRKRNWVIAAVSKDAPPTYIDTTTIRKDGHFRKAWWVTDMKQQGEDGAMSIQVLAESDCKEERLRLLTTYRHSEPMALGKVIQSVNGPAEWTYPHPDSIGLLIIKFVCAK